MAASGSQPGTGASASFDITELVELATMIEGARPRLRREVKAVLKRGGQNVKTDAQKRYRAQAGKHGRGHAWKYPASINYDVTVKGWETTVEIGPDRSKPQAALGNLLEYGSANNAPLPHLNPALQAEIPKTTKYLSDALVRAVLGP